MSKSLNFRILKNSLPLVTAFLSIDIDSEGTEMTFLKTLVLSLIFVTADTVCGEEALTIPTKTIPLNTIWAWDMPGTKDVRELEADCEKFKKMVVPERIQKSLAMNTYSHLNPYFKIKGGIDDNAGSAFVVDAVGLAALKQANAIFARKQEPKDNFKAGSALTLVFYAYSSSQFAHINEVLNNENEIVVKYHFHVHGMRISTKHYALVPLGEGLRGKIKVTIKRTEDVVEKRLANSSSPIPELTRKLDAKKWVSGSTVFRVLEPPK